MAQFSEEKRKHPLSLRLTDTEQERLKTAFGVEKLNPKNEALSETSLGQKLVVYGLTLHEAIELAGVEKFRAAVRAHGGEEDEALADLLSRAFEAWEKDPKARPPKKPRK